MIVRGSAYHQMMKRKRNSKARRAAQPRVRVETKVRARSACDAYRKLAALRGKVKFSIDLETMRY